MGWSSDGKEGGSDGKEGCKDGGSDHGFFTESELIMMNCPETEVFVF